MKRASTWETPSQLKVMTCQTLCSQSTQAPAHRRDLAGCIQGASVLVISFNFLEVLRKGTFIISKG